MAVPSPYQSNATAEATKPLEEFSGFHADAHVFCLVLFFVLLALDMWPVDCPVRLQRRLRCLLLANPCYLVGTVRLLTLSYLVDMTCALLMSTMQIIRKSK